VLDVVVVVVGATEVVVVVVGAIVDVVVVVVGIQPVTNAQNIFLIDRLFAIAPSIANAIASGHNF
jgi:hypothetical protein